MIGFPSREKNLHIILKWQFYNFCYFMKNTAKPNMTRSVCASSMYSCLCKFLLFLFVHAWHGQCHVYILEAWYHFQFKSVVVWLSP